MNPGLESILKSLGAQISEGVVHDFGDPAAELIAVRDGSYMANLAQFGVLTFTGPDSTEFLQGQLSCDVKALGRTRASPGSYCTPKGRMLASFIMWRSGADYFLQLPHLLCEPIRKRLSMYVLRSKVQAVDVSDDWKLFGVTGPGEIGRAHV